MAATRPDLTEALAASDSRCRPQQTGAASPQGNDTRKVIDMRSKPVPPTLRALGVQQPGGYRAGQAKGLRTTAPLRLLGGMRIARHA
jgi:hypothetical protein